MLTEERHQRILALLERNGYRESQRIDPSITSI